MLNIQKAILISIFLYIGTSSVSVLAQTNYYFNRHLNRSTKRKSISFLKFVSNFALHASTGAGVTFYYHKINGPVLLQQKNGNVFLFDKSSSGGKNLSKKGYSNWVNNAKPIDNIPIKDKDFLLKTSTTPVTYTGISNSIPLSITISYVFNRYQLGAGFTYEQSFAAKYYPNIKPANLNPFKPEHVNTSMIRYYGYAGVNVYQSKRHTIAIDATIGNYKFNKKIFNPSQIKYKLFVNIGVSLERSLSEYFKIFIRPSVEFKNYDLHIPNLNYTIKHKAPALYLNVGVIMRISELKKCRVSACLTQKNHLHGNYLYRSKVHPFWKWQNPNYGQNYPKNSSKRKKNEDKKKISPPFSLPSGLNNFDTPKK